MSIWYPRYLGDYAKSTADLSTFEHGILTLLLDHYYAAGPIDQDWYRIYRITRVGRGTTQRQQAQNIMLRYFTIGQDNKWHQERADQERTNMASKQAKAKAAADKRWLKLV